MSALPLVCMALLVYLGTVTVLTTGCTNGLVRLQPTSTSNQGIVQLCANRKWRTVCNNDNWDTHTANLVCKQLGYLDRGAEADSRCLILQTDGYITIKQRCNTLERLTRCNLNRNTGGCPSCTNGKSQAYVICSPECEHDKIRLVDGNTNREGRVEVCINGQWGTVCSNSQREVAKAVCKELGFPSQDSVLEIFVEGTGAIYNCRMNEDMTLNCSSTNAYDCGHSTDLGVVCQSYQDISQQQCNMSTVLPPVTCRNCPSNVTSPPTCENCSHCVRNVSTTPEQNCENSSTNGALGAIIGILLALLVAIVIGWLCTCVALKRRNSNYKLSNGNLGNAIAGESSLQDQRQLDNPVYDGTTTQPHPPASYSSLGPAYETVEANEEAGHTYDDVNRDADNRKEGRQNSRDKKPRRPEIRNARESGANLLPDNNYNVLDHTGEQDHHDYHVLEQSNGNEEQHVYHVLEQSEHRNKQGGSVRGGGDPNPLDYEVPTPRVVSRGAGQDEGEYSQLKH